MARTARDAVERALQRPVPDETWEQAVADGLEEEIELGRLAPDEVARRLRAYGAAYRQSQRRSSLGVVIGPRAVPGADMLDRRAEAISEWAARGARSVMAVEKFRRRYLVHPTINTRT